MTLEFIKEPQLEFLKEGSYIRENETPLQRFTEIVNRVRDYEPMYGKGLADRIAYLLDKNILCLSTPALANFGRAKNPNSNTQSLPASCNIITVGDSIASIYNSVGQAAMLSKLGAGVGMDFQKVSQKRTELFPNFFTNPKLDWIELGVKTGKLVSQASTRRGYVTPFISILDSEFFDLMDRVDKNNPNPTDPLIMNTIGIIIPEGFMNSLKDNKEYQKRWVRILEERRDVGRVYIIFQENLNKNSSPVYERLGLPVSTSNICTEFLQPLFEEYTSVCVISALNLNYWDEIKRNPQYVKDAIAFLDILNEEYVRLSEGVPFLEKAHASARDKRDIGLGTLGFADLLQSKMMAFGDVQSRRLNKEIYSFIRTHAEQATVELAKLLGSAPICEKAGMVRRNASLMMIAPNKSSSFFNGATSLGIEPFMSNIFVKKLAKINYVFKNRHLEKLLEEKGKNTKEVWDSITMNKGSVKHLDFLTDDEKKVFYTFAEISPKDIIDLAADRQVYIDMGQSLNLMFRKNYTIQDLVSIHKYAYEKGIKTLYYAYSTGHAAIEQEGEAWDTCVSCAD